MAALQTVAILLVAVGMGLSLAHALEFPGKMRLVREEYFTVQKIYYPGFTIGGVFGEFGAILATAVLLLTTHLRRDDVSLVLVALAALLVAHAIFWLLTQPVNKTWLQDQHMGRVGAAFFSAVGNIGEDQDWTRLRDRWEYSHVARSVCFMAALAALIADAVFM